MFQEDESASDEGDLYWGGENAEEPEATDIRA